MSASLFKSAIEAIVTGDEAELKNLLAAHPELARQRAASDHRATLLHYVAANGVEVQADLVDVFADYGAAVDGVEGEGGPLGCALLFGYTQAAERLALRGARVDNVIYAAGLGRTDMVRQMIETGSGVQNITRRTDARAGRFSFPVPKDADSIEVAMIVAAMHNRLPTLRVLLDSGVDVNAAPFCGQTALHFAAYFGRHSIVEELLSRGADTRLVETQFGKAAGEWARETAHTEIAERLARR